MSQLAAATRCYWHASRIACRPDIGGNRDVAISHLATIATHEPSARLGRLAARTLMQVTDDGRDPSELI
jgi:hypothetical protein